MSAVGSVYCVQTRAHCHRDQDETGAMLKQNWRLHLRVVRVARGWKALGPPSFVIRACQPASQVPVYDHFNLTKNNTLSNLDLS